MGVDDDYYTDAVLDLVINQALRHVSMQEDWPWLEDNSEVTLLANNPVIDITDIRKIRWVREGDRNISFQNYRSNARSFSTDRKGRPQNYVEESMSYRVLPTPDKEYTLKIGFTRASDNTLTGNGDEPLMPDWAIDLLITWSMVLLSRRGRDRDLAGMWFSQYRETLSRLRDEITRSTEGILPLKTRSWVD